MSVKAKQPVAGKPQKPKRTPEQMRARRAVRRIRKAVCALERLNDMAKLVRVSLLVTAARERLRAAAASPGRAES